MASSVGVGGLKHWTSHLVAGNLLLVSAAASRGLFCVGSPWQADWNWLMHVQLASRLARDVVHHDLITGSALK
jgi:hypothetical protein